MDYQGLQNKIQLVPINLLDKPAWYKEKVHPENKVDIYTYIYIIQNFTDKAIYLVCLMDHFMHVLVIYVEGAIAGTQWQGFGRKS